MKPVTLQAGATGKGRRWLLPIVAAVVAMLTTDMAPAPAAAQVAPTAQASSTKYAGPRLCEKKWGGNYVRVGKLTIPAKAGHANGRLVISKTAEGWRYCAVTIRRYHKNQKWTAVRLKRYEDSTWTRQDRSHIYTEYAGPVVRRAGRSHCVNTRGQIGKGWAIANVCDRGVVYFTSGWG
ncbi:MAG: hypothetical protein GEV03_22795 [Streptosporangiales bacterium]|nr:hypothetical protein [Streptosporangiales bacterium]